MNCPACGIGVMNLECNNTFVCDHCRQVGGDTDDSQSFPTEEEWKIIKSKLD